MPEPSCWRSPWPRAPLRAGPGAGCRRSEDFFKGVGIDPDGTYVIAGDRHGAAGSFELKAGSLTFTSIGVEAIPPIVGSFALYPEKYVSRDGRFVIARGMDEELRVWDRRAGKPVPGIEGRIWPFHWP